MSAITVYLSSTNAPHLTDWKARQQNGLEIDGVETALNIKEQHLLPEILRRQDGTLLLEITRPLASLLDPTGSTVGALYFFLKYSSALPSCCIDIGDKWRFFGDIVSWPEPCQDVSKSRRTSRSKRKVTQVRGKDTKIEKHRNTTDDQSQEIPMKHDTFYIGRYKLFFQSAVDRNPCTKKQSSVDESQAEESCTKESLMEERPTKEVLPEENPSKESPPKDSPTRENPPKGTRTNERSPKESQMKESPPEESHTKESPLEESQMKESFAKESHMKKSLSEESQMKESFAKESHMKESLSEESQMKESSPKESHMKENPPEESQMKESSPKESHMKENPPEEGQIKESAPERKISKRKPSKGKSRLRNEKTG